MAATAPPPTPRDEKTYTRSDIETLIAAGQLLVVVSGRVLRLDAWLPFHPGGDKAIRHMVGRDATDEVTALHSEEARRRMMAFCVGRVEGRWMGFVPPIQGGRFRGREELEMEMEMDGGEVAGRGDAVGSRRRRRTKHSEGEEPERLAHLDHAGGALDLDAWEYPSLDAEVQAEIVRKYRLLHERIEAEGLYGCKYGDYVVDGMRCAALFAGSMLLLRSGWLLASALLLGGFWHQLAFAAHDAGHMGITHDFTTDTVIGIVVADFLGGLSLGWWKRNHNVHHIVTNSPEHDPDIQHVPFFAVSSRFFDSLRSSYYERVMKFDGVAKTLLPYQHWLYYPVLLFGRFNLYFLSWEYLVRGQGPKKGPAWWTRWLETAGQLVFWAWFGYGVVYRGVPTAWQRVVFMLVSHMATMPVHAQITLSHFAMSTRDAGPRESFPQRMLRTTMDVECPAWLDWVHGGLQFQVVHHLFPRVPRHNLRRARVLVRAFCDEVGVPYAVFGFVEGSRRVVGRLEEVGRLVRILKECQRREWEEKGW